jgi:hypothetical protein
MTHNEHIVIRSATAADERALNVLAVLDGGTKRPAGQILLAEVEGRVRAAIGSNGHSVSDPFWPSADLVSMLRVHADAVGTVKPRASRFALRRPALA